MSDFAAAELASAVARRVRTREFSPDQAHAVFSNFDAWAAWIGPRVCAQVSDVAGAEALLRRLDLPLRTPDALHIAIVQRLGATLATFDKQMARSAVALGLPVADF